MSFNSVYHESENSIRKSKTKFNKLGLIFHLEKFQIHFLNEMGYF